MKIRLRLITLSLYWNMKLMVCVHGWVHSGLANDKLRQEAEKEKEKNIETSVQNSTRPFSLLRRRAHILRRFGMKRTPEVEWEAYKFMPLSSFLSFMKFNYLLGLQEVSLQVSSRKMLQRLKVKGALQKIHLLTKARENYPSRPLISWS